jgi:magnesium-transporting ATPase (P-type)
VQGEGVKANESSLTGEPDDLNKHHSKDPFLLSSSLLTDQGTSPEIYMITIAVGSRSQWGKIRANLVEESNPTPLQEKLEDAAKLIGSVKPPSREARLGLAVHH